jgi:hypothetical protein
VTFVDTTTGTTLGTGTLSGGSASLKTSALAVGTNKILAVYSGDKNFITSYSTMTQTAQYHFSGFLSPLSNGLTFAANRTIPIKFQLTDYTGAYVSSLSAVTSLQVLNSSGTDVLAGAGKTGLRYDSTANQFVYNWQTKGLPAGSYQIVLKLADGAMQTKTISLMASGNGANAQSVDGSDVTGGTAAGQLLGGNVELYVDNSNGELTPDELARIQGAVNAVDATIAPYGVAINEVTDPTQADVTLNMGSRSAFASNPARLLE